MSEPADVIVIGGGVQGASLAFHLAKRGTKVIVLEKKFVGAGATGVELAAQLHEVTNAEIADSLAMLDTPVI